MKIVARTEDLAQLCRMRLASTIEGATLLLLVFVAVPAKYLVGIPQATSVMGPVHGVAFVFYFWMFVQTVSSGGWTWSEITRLGLLSFIPFGALFNDRTLARKERDVASSPMEV